MGGMNFWDSIGAGVSGTVKAVTGMVQYIKNQNRMNKLLANRPQYNISKGYVDAYNTYKRLASSEMPGMNIMQDQIGQSSARTNTAAARGAMSSNQYMDAVLGSQDKELQALQSLAVMNQQWRSQQQNNLASAQNQMGQLQDMQWQTNVLDPWNIRANMAAEGRQMGAQNFFSGIDDIAQVTQSYAGTSYYNNLLKGLQGQQTTTKAKEAYTPVGPGE